MDPQAKTPFLLIRQPMALAANTIARSPSADKLVLDPRAWLYDEDVFSHLLSGPLVVVHYGLYCFVPIYYLLCYSPFSTLAPATLCQTLLQWSLAVVTVYLTAVLAVTCLGPDCHFTVRRELLACLCIGSAVFLGARTEAHGR